MLDLYIKYPHIHTKVTTLWGTPDCRKYLLKLIGDNPDGTKQGFTTVEAGALVDLLTKHDMLFPKLDDTSNFIDTGFYSVLPKHLKDAPKESILGGWFMLIVIFSIACAIVTVKITIFSYL